jgi:hypothetical protein
MIICLPISLLLRSSLEMNPTCELRVGIFRWADSANFGNTESVTRHGNVPSDDMDIEHGNQALVD